MDVLSFCYRWLFASCLSDFSAASHINCTIHTVAPIPFLEMLSNLGCGLTVKWSDKEGTEGKCPKASKSKHFFYPSVFFYKLYLQTNFAFDSSPHSSSLRLIRSSTADIEETIFLSVDSVWSVLHELFIIHMYTLISIEVEHLYFT